MSMILEAPQLASVHRGAIREALADANSLARIGRQDTRAWERRDLYVVDDNEGSAGLVQFFSGACIGVISSVRAPAVLDVAATLPIVPISLREHAASLCEAPLLVFGGKQRITTVFWSEGDALVGPAPWREIYLSGAEILRGELLEDDAWKLEATDYYGLDGALAGVIVSIASRAVPLEPIALTARERDQILPRETPHRDEAFQQLVEGGAFLLEQPPF